MEVGDTYIVACSIERLDVVLTRGFNKAFLKIVWEDANSEDKRHRCFS
jgi:hypothetical protein